MYSEIAWVMNPAVYNKILFTPSFTIKIINPSQNHLFGGFLSDFDLKIEFSKLQRCSDKIAIYSFQEILISNRTLSMHEIQIKGQYIFNLIRKIVNSNSDTGRLESAIIPLKVSIDELLLCLSKSAEI